MERMELVIIVVPRTLQITSRPSTALSDSPPVIMPIVPCVVPYDELVAVDLTPVNETDPRLINHQLVLTRWLASIIEGEIENLV